MPRANANLFVDQKQVAGRSVRTATRALGEESRPKELPGPPGKGAATIPKIVGNYHCARTPVLFGWGRDEKR
jgi:hypothetical protein